MIIIIIIEEMTIMIEEEMIIEIIKAIKVVEEITRAKAIIEIEDIMVVAVAVEATIVVVAIMIEDTSDSIGKKLNYVSFLENSFKSYIIYLE